ncbi:acanthoscurrin-1 isoform X2 [Manduca sexta]|uniref:Uncharacterized protein n=1 Tax=Manduca sexta TaxID=7130 RepID=A0A921YTV6_MANSE|nr:acanthoscurrin-1 isoform X2 [Manduca sexta]KAG6445861.1 hypothetical protein O3G_MSEX004152 [Manduca sexta]
MLKNIITYACFVFLLGIQEISSTSGSTDKPSAMSHTESNPLATLIVDKNEIEDVNNSDKMADEVLSRVKRYYPYYYRRYPPIPIIVGGGIGFGGIGFGRGFGGRGFGGRGFGGGFGGRGFGGGFGGRGFGGGFGGRGFGGGFGGRGFGGRGFGGRGFGSRGGGFGGRGGGFGGGRGGIR